MRDLHSALKTTVEASADEGGIHFLKVRLQHGKSEFVDTLHARPHTWSTAGVQSTDFLSLLGFVRSPCAFQQGGEGFCRMAPDGLDLASFARAVAEAHARVDRADRRLRTCGLTIRQPEGWGYFYGKPTQERSVGSRCHGDGHASPKVTKMKEAEDDYFRFAFTWIEGGSDKGWTTHYRAKHMPLRSDFESVLEFLGGFSWFPDCPEFEFEGCWWRFTAYNAEGSSFFGGNAEIAHSWFDAHAQNFSAGIRELLEAHALLRAFGLTFLPSTPRPAARSRQVSNVTRLRSTHDANPAQDFDVAISFAGAERQIAEEIATRVRDAGFAVFYDDFYPEQLWGADLVEYFDRVYRKQSRFCLMLISKEYSERLWTTHERRSATARALLEKGTTYILPVRIDDTDIDGLPPTIGYVAIGNHTPASIAELLLKKLRS